MNTEPLFIADPQVSTYMPIRQVVFEFTANPVQKDHVHLVEIAIKFIETFQPNIPLNITVIPVFMHPYEHKNKLLIDFSHRLEMTKHAFGELSNQIKARGHTLTVIDATEFMGKQWFSHQLVEKLHQQYSEKPTYIIGSDNAAGLHTWNTSENLFAHANFMVIPREGASVEAIRASFAPQLQALTTGNNPQILIVPLNPNYKLVHSSTKARTALKQVDYQEPHTVLATKVPQLAPKTIEYITQKKLYQ